MPPSKQIRDLGGKPVVVPPSSSGYFMPYIREGLKYQIRALLSTRDDYLEARTTFYWEANRICRSENMQFKMMKCKDHHIIDFMCDDLDWLLTAKLQDGVLWNSIKYIYQHEPSEEE